MLADLNFVHGPDHVSCTDEKCVVRFIVVLPIGMHGVQRILEHEVSWLRWSMRQLETLPSFSQAVKSHAVRCKERLCASVLRTIRVRSCNALQAEAKVPVKI